MCFFWLLLLCHSACRCVLLILYSFSCMTFLCNVLVLLLFVFFFFFKQKTAYEWRISDWSSDVCSSDLTASRLCCLWSGWAIGGGVSSLRARRAGAISSRSVFVASLIKFLRSNRKRPRTGCAKSGSASVEGDSFSSG